MSELFLPSRALFNRIRPYLLLSHWVPRIDDLRVASRIFTLENMIFSGRCSR